MKFLLSFMFVAVALAEQESEPETSQEIVARSLTRVFQINPVDSLKCVHKTDVTIADLRYMENVIDVFDTETTDMKKVKKASCAIQCCAEKMGVMVGGVLQVEELFKFFKKIGIPEHVEIEVHNLVRICKEQVADISDECMVVYKLTKCVLMRSQTIGPRK